ncbi:MAG: hypothetical protein RIS29_1828 [Bacteroidota bacterium]|jgi:hypothetical protein
MDYYYLSKQARDNGDHEIHKQGCRYMPLERYVQALGQFTHSVEALKEAKELFPQANGCFYCCFHCHTEGSRQEQPSDNLY